jgi:uncharacterized protein YggL (DUF469 family)
MCYMTHHTKRSIRRMSKRRQKRHLVGSYTALGFDLTLTILNVEDMPGFLNALDQYIEQDKNLSLLRAVDGNTISMTVTALKGRPSVTSAMRTRIETYLRTCTTHSAVLTVAPMYDLNRVKKPNPCGVPNEQE